MRYLAQLHCFAQDCARIWPLHFILFFWERIGQEAFFGHTINITLNYILTEKQALCRHLAEGLFVVHTFPVNLVGHVVCG